MTKSDVDRFWLTAVVVCFLPLTARAQEALRQSIVGKEAGATRKSALEIQAYTTSRPTP